MCHKDALAEHDTYEFSTAVPDGTNTFRIFYSTHASYQDNQKLIRFLQPQITTKCVKLIMPDNCEASGSSTPNWDYYDSQEHELRTFKSQRKKS